MSHLCWQPGSPAHRTSRCALRLVLAAALLSAGVSAHAQDPADLVGPADMVANGSARFVDGVARLTNAPWQAGSAFTVVPVDIRGFRTTFTCRVTPIPGLATPPADGLTFTLQGIGPTALGNRAGYLGYAGIGRSVAVKLDTWLNPPDPSWSTTGLFINGEKPMGGQALHDEIGLSAGHVIEVSLVYTGQSRLDVLIRDLATGHAWSDACEGIDIPAIVGGPTAYAGFTAGTGVSYAFHDILAWDFVDATNRAPVADAGPDQVVEAEGPAGAMVALDGSASCDPDGDALAYAWDLNGDGIADAAGPVAHVAYPLGTHVAALAVTDTHGALSTDSVTIRVVDTTAPEIRSVTVDPAFLWPPNGQMVDVTLAVDAADRVDASPTARITGVTCSEPSAREGVDWQITGDLALELRARRGGSGEGRTYTIHVECRDASGNRSTATVGVTVPHDRERKAGGRR